MTPDLLSRAIALDPEPPEPPSLQRVMDQLAIQAEIATSTDRAAWFVAAAGWLRRLHSENSRLRAENGRLRNGLRCEQERR